MLLTELPGFILGFELFYFGFSWVAFRLLYYEGCKQSSDLSDMAYCAALCLQGLPKPSPPRHTTSDFSFLSSSLKAFSPVMGRQEPLSYRVLQWLEYRSAMSGMLFCMSTCLHGPCLFAS